MDAYNIVSDSYGILTLTIIHLRILTGYFAGFVETLGHIIDQFFQSFLTGFQLTRGEEILHNDISLKKHMGKKSVDIDKVHLR